MNSPSDELKALVENVKHPDSKVVVEWAKLFLGLPIFDDFSGVWSSNQIVKDNFEHVTDDNEGSEDLMWFFVDLNPSRGDSYSHNVLVTVHMNGTAEIGPSLTRNNKDIFPGFLDHADFRGFKGTWEQVLRKLVELNDLVQSQILDLPKVPEDLKS